MIQMLSKLLGDERQQILDNLEEDDKKELNFVLTGSDWKSVEDSLKFSMMIQEEIMRDTEEKELYRLHKEALNKLEYDPNDEEPQGIDLSYRDVSIIASALQAVKDYFEENTFDYKLLTTTDFADFKIPKNKTISALGTQYLLGKMFFNGD